MKLEIEITEDEIKSALAHKVRAAIASQNNAWNAENFIKDEVEKVWKNAVRALIDDMLRDPKAIKDMIDKAVEGKVKARVTAALKAI